MLNKSYIGLDISDRSVEVAELVKSGGEIRLANLGRVKLDEGIIERGRLKNQDKLLEAVAKAFAQAKPQAIKGSEVVFGLQEARVFSKVMPLPEKDSKHRQGLVLEEARRHLAVTEEDLIYNVKILSDSQSLGQKQTFVVATNKKVMQEWQEFFAKANLIVSYFDLEPLAVFRGLYKKELQQPVCLVDLGTNTTGVAIYTAEGLQYFESLKQAGKFFTKQIASELGVDLEAAEKLKIDKGLINDKKVGKVLAGTLDLIFDQLKQILDNFAQSSPQPVQEVVLVGGSAQLKGLLSYAANHLSAFKVTLGGSALRDARASLLYLGAIGFALREADQKWPQTDPVIPLLNLAKGGKTAAVKGALARQVDSIAIAGAEAKPRSAFHFPFKTVLSLIFILLVGGLGVWYFQLVQSQSQEPAADQDYAFTTVLNFPLQLSLKEGGQVGSLSGRLLENTIEAADSPAQALLASRSLVVAQLAEGEYLWPESLTPLPAEADFVLPLSFTWLAYPKAEVETSLNNLTMASLPAETRFIIKNISYNKLTETDNPGIYLLYSQVSLATDKFVDLAAQLEFSSGSADVAQPAETADLPAPAPAAPATLRVIETSTGWLNVRTGPGTSYDILTKVNVGDELEIIGEEQEWYQVSLPGDLGAGWIYALYTEKIPNLEP